jgi:hypothetical protein
VSDQRRIIIGLLKTLGQKVEVSGLDSVTMRIDNSVVKQNE